MGVSVSKYLRKVDRKTFLDIHILFMQDNRVSHLSELGMAVSAKFCNFCTEQFSRKCFSMFVTFNKISTVFQSFGYHRY